MRRRLAVWLQSRCVVERAMSVLFCSSSCAFHSFDFILKWVSRKRLGLELGKRMAYAKTVLRVDPEPALKALALSLTAFSSRLKQYQDPAATALVQLNEHKTQRKVRSGVFAARVEYVSLDGSDTCHGHVAMVGTTRRMVARKVSCGRRRLKIASGNRTKERS